MLDLVGVGPGRATHHVCKPATGPLSKPKKKAPSKDRYGCNIASTLVNESRGWVLKVKGMANVAVVLLALRGSASWEAVAAGT